MKFHRKGYCDPPGRLNPSQRDASTAPQMHSGKQRHTKKRWQPGPNSPCVLEGMPSIAEGGFPNVRRHVSPSSSSLVCCPSLCRMQLRWNSISKDTEYALPDSSCRNETHVRGSKYAPEDNFIQKSVCLSRQTRRGCWRACALAWRQESRTYGAMPPLSRPRRFATPLAVGCN